MALMKIPHFTVAQHLSPAQTINLHARMVDVSIRGGFVITIMIAAMDLTKVNSAMLNTRLARHKNSPVRTLSASEINIDAMVSFDQ